jgi:hypothetical protein
MLLNGGQLNDKRLLSPKTVELMSAVVDPKEKIVGILMVQTNNPNRELDRDLENAVMQAVVE